MLRLNKASNAEADLRCSGPEADLRWGSISAFPPLCADGVSRWHRKAVLLPRIPRICVP